MTVIDFIGCVNMKYIILSVFFVSVITFSNEENKSLEVDVVTEWLGIDFGTMELNNGELCYFNKKNVDLYKIVSSPYFLHIRYKATCVDVDPIELQGITVSKILTKLEQPQSIKGVVLKGSLKGSEPNGTYLRFISI